MGPDPSSTTATEAPAVPNNDASTATNRIVDRPQAWHWIGAATVALIVVAVIAIRVSSRLVGVAGLVLSAITVAAITAPIVGGLARRIGSAAAVTFNAIATLLLAGVVKVAVMADLRAQLGAIGDSLRSGIESLRPGSTPARLARATGIGPGIDRWLTEVPAIVVNGEAGGTGIGKSLVELLFIVTLAAFLQSYRGSFVDAFSARWPRADDPNVDGASRTDVRAFVADVERRGLGHVRRLVVVGSIAGIATATGWALLSLPGPLVVGMWVAVWCLVPSLGPATALTPLVAFALISPSAPAWTGLALAAGVCVAAALARRRRVEPATMRLGASLHMVGVAMGAGLGGVNGTIVGLTFVAVAAAAASSPLRPGVPAGFRRSLRDLGNARRGRLLVGAALAITTTAVISALALAMLGRAIGVITWIVVGGFIAVALSRPVAWLERHRVATPAARGIVLASIGLVLVGSLIAGADDGARTSTEATDRAPEIVRELESAPVIGSWLRERDAATWIEEQLEDLPQKLAQARPTTWLPTASEWTLHLLWTIGVSIALLVDGGRLVRRGLAATPAVQRRQAERLVGAAHRALAGYAGGAALVAAINAGAVFTIATVLGIGSAPVLAVWAFVWNFVPQIGGFMGGVPLILFALVAGPATALIAGLAFFAYQLIENHVIQPAVISAAIDVAPWATLLAALAGGAAAGAIGAVLFTPLVGVIRTAATEIRRPDFPGATRPSTALTTEKLAGVAPLAGT